MTIVIALLLFGIIILIHEFGHFLLAKKNEIIIIRKDCLKVSIREFIDFLKQKDTKIKKCLYNFN